MKTQHLRITFLALLLATSAHAKLNMTSIEKLRGETIVVRAASDHPDSAEVKTCSLHLDFAKLGAQLELRTNEAQANWKQMSITFSDMATLRPKVKDCVSRASSQILDLFLASVQIQGTKTVEDAASLRKRLADQIPLVTSQTYLQAWSGVKGPCSVLRRMQ
jgi:hypothetical protein